MVRLVGEKHGRNQNSVGFQELLPAGFVLLALSFFLLFALADFSFAFRHGGWTNGDCAAHGQKTIWLATAKCISIKLNALLQIILS